MPPALLEYGSREIAVFAVIPLLSFMGAASSELLAVPLFAAAPSLDSASVCFATEAQSLLSRPATPA